MFGEWMAPWSSSEKSCNKMSQLLPKTHFSLNSFPLDVQETLPVSTKIRQYFLARVMLLWSKVKEKTVKMAQSCSTLCDPMDYTVCRILQAKILEWVAFPFSRGSSQPRDQTQGSLALQVASLPAERHGKPKNNGVGTDLPDLGIKPGSPALQVDSLPSYQGSPLWSKL